jgi:hypothetical protein
MADDKARIEIEIALRDAISTMFNDMEVFKTGSQLWQELSRFGR